MTGDLQFLVPGGALSGPLMAALIRGMEQDRPQLVSGAILGAFVITREIGRGGSSTIYLASRVGSDFQQNVAIKVVRANDALKEAFRVERRILAALAHPNLARLIDGGESEEGYLWLAMEYVEGATIDRYCGENELNWKKRVQLLIDVLDAIKYAHCHLVCHGDIKPNNIMVDGSGTVRLLDFGISSHKSESQAGHRALSPKWASPEQINGDLVAASSDIYQLGLLLDALIFDGGGDPLRMSRMERKELKGIIELATRHNPEERYASAAAMQRDLIRLRDNLPISAIDACWYRSFHYLRRHRISVSIAMFCTCTLLGGVLISMAQLRNERDASLLLARSAQVATREAESSSEILIAALSVNGAADLRIAEEQWFGASKMEPDRLAGMAIQLSRVYSETGQFNKASGVLDHALARINGRVAETSVPYLRLLEQRAYLGVVSDDLPTAARYFKLATARTHHLTDSKVRAIESGRLRAYQALALGVAGKYRAAEINARRAVEQLVNASGPQHIDTGRALAILAWVAAENGDHAIAADAVNRALRIFRTSSGESHPRVFHLVVQLATIYALQGKLDAAESALTNAIESERKLYPGNSRRLARHLSELARLRFEQGRFRQVIRQAQDVEALYVGTELERHSFRARVKMLSGNARLQMGDVPGALADFDLAQQIFAKVGSLDAGMAVVGIAEAKARSGHAQQAERLFRDVVTLYASSSESIPPVKLAIVQLRFSRFLHAQGRHEEGIALLALARPVFSESGVGSPSERRLLREVVSLYGGSIS